MTVPRHLMDRMRAAASVSCPVSTKLMVVVQHAEEGLLKNQIMTCSQITQVILTIKLILIGTFSTSPKGAGQKLERRPSSRLVSLHGFFKH